MPNTLQPTSNSPVRVAVFAHNEERNIARAIESLLEEGRAFTDYRIHVLVNGSSDRTQAIAQQYEKATPQRIRVHLFSKGDKAGTWNRYVQEISLGTDDAAIHFFMDGDVWPEPGSILKMADTLHQNQELAAVGGLPMSGRNREAYQKLAQDKHLIYGNLYATRGSWLAWARQVGFTIPEGLIAEDWIVTNAFTTLEDDLRRSDLARVGHVDGCGYCFRSLQPWRPSEISLYLRRLVTYRLAAAQLKLIGWRWPDEMPKSAEPFNQRLLSKLKQAGLRQHPLDYFLMRRLAKKLEPQMP